MDLALGHVNDLDVLVPEVEQLKNVLEALLERFQAKCDIRPNFLLALREENCVKLPELSQAFVSPGLRRLTFDRALDLLPPGEVVAHDFVLRCEAHRTDLRLEVPENRLKQHVFLLDNELVVQDVLHGCVVAELRVDGQPLQFVRVLLIVEHRLRDDDICVDFLCEVGQVWPVLGSLHLEAVEHQLVFNVSPHVADVRQFHRFKRLALLRNFADLRTPLVHVVAVLLLYLLAQVIEVLVLDLCLHTPVVNSMLLPALFHVKLELLELVFEVIVDLTGDAHPHAELRHRSEQVVLSAAPDRLLEQGAASLLRVKELTEHHFCFSSTVL